MKDTKIDEGNYVKSSYNSDTIISIDTTCHVNSDFNITSDSDSDSNSDSSSLYNCDKDSNTNNDYNIGLKETRLFLYRYFTISIITN